MILISNRDYILSYLTNTCKYNTAIACGILANIYKESAYNPQNLQQTGEKKLGMSDKEYTNNVNSGKYSVDEFIHDGFGYGLVQWTWWSRKDELYKRTVKKGISIGNIDAQLQFMTDEMRGYKELMHVINTAVNTEQEAYNVAYAMCTIYEKPDKMEQRGVERGNYAKELYREFANDSSVEKWYRVRTNWENASSQLGAYMIYDNALDCAKRNRGYNVYDWNGKIVYQSQPYLVQVTVDKTPIYTKPNGTLDGYTGKGIFTIIERDGEYGKLKSGAGWISVTNLKIVG